MPFRLATSKPPFRLPVLDGHAAWASDPERGAPICSQVAEIKMSQFMSNGYELSRCRMIAIVRELVDVPAFRRFRLHQESDPASIPSPESNGTSSIRCRETRCNMSFSLSDERFPNAGKEKASSGRS